MTMPTFDSMDDVQLAVLRQVVSDGADVRPRGVLTKEVLGLGFTLRNPRARTIQNHARNWSYPLAIGEFCWHSAGSNSVDDISYYAPAWSEVSDDGEHITGSDYGRRVFGRGYGLSQWEQIVALLRSDPQTRRAVLQFYSSDRADLISSADIACALTCQFFIRDGALHAVVSMRSNDVIWGLPYDVFLFSMLQERMALELGVKLGVYSHFAASMHLYERHYDLARRVLDAPAFEQRQMPPMERLDELSAFLRIEADIRMNGKLSAPRLSGYWGKLEAVLLDFAKRRRHSAKDRTKISKLV